MKYLVLRDCYINRFYHAGDKVELPDAMEKSPKNFQPLEEIPAETVLPPENQIVEPLETSLAEPPLYVSKKDREKLEGK